MYVTDDATNDDRSTNTASRFPLYVSTSNAANTIMMAAMGTIICAMSAASDTASTRLIDAETICGCFELFRLSYTGNTTGELVSTADHHHEERRHERRIAGWLRRLAVLVPFHSGHRRRLDGRAGLGRGAESPSWPCSPTQAVVTRLVGVDSVLIPTRDAIVRFHVTNRIRQCPGLRTGWVPWRSTKPLKVASAASALGRHVHAVAGDVALARGGGQGPFGGAVLEDVHARGGGVGRGSDHVMRATPRGGRVSDWSFPGQLHSHPIIGSYGASSSTLGHSASVAAASASVDRTAAFAARRRATRAAHLDGSEGGVLG